MTPGRTIRHRSVTASLARRMATRPDVQERHRRRRIDARRRVLDAASALLEERPWSAISLGEVMREADLSRTAFYRLFEDRQQLLLALLEDFGPRLARVSDGWLRPDAPGADPAAAAAPAAAADPRESLYAALRGLIDVYVRPGRLLAAVAEAAGSDDAVRE